MPTEALQEVKVSCLFWAVFALALGVTVLTAPRTVDAAKLCCYMVCTLDRAIACWEVSSPDPIPIETEYAKQ